MLVLKHASLATVEQLFRYKHMGFELEGFPGYSNDQWGIKAHNRPWIEDAGCFRPKQKIIEVGGGYSLLPKYLAQKYDLEAWVADDFGIDNLNNSLWARWGDPRAFSKMHPNVKYVFENFGSFSTSYPDHYFDRIFTVSTLEHVPVENRLNVLKDLHRCLKSSGIQLHTIDIPTVAIRRALKYSVLERFIHLLPMMKPFIKSISTIADWIRLFEESGVKIECSIPGSLQLLDRSTLIESPDVIYRFYPPKNTPKRYSPAASLLLILENKTV